MNIKNGNSGKPKKKLAAFLPWICITAMLIGAIFFFMASGREKSPEYYEIVSTFKNKEVTEYSLNLSSGALTYKVKGENVEKSYTVPNVSLSLRMFMRI